MVPLNDKGQRNPEPRDHTTHRVAAGMRFDTHAKHLASQYILISIAGEPPPLPQAGEGKTMRETPEKFPSPACGRGVGERVVGSWGAQCKRVLMGIAILTDKRHDIPAEDGD